MIKTGKQPISVMTYIAILAVCFIINLPGVAIAPVEGKLRSLLHTSELEIQLLTTLPNFVIIPFVLLAGKLSDYKHKIPLIIVALLLFIGCGVFYIFTDSMTGLIVASCLLGCADGILIPFAMGFMVNTFDGKYRTRHLGIKSATSNLGTVVANFVVGFLVNLKNWHIPFAVYLIALFPLLLCCWLRNVPGFGHVPVQPSSYQNVSDKNECMKDIDNKKIWSLIGNNVAVTFITFSIVIYLPQLLQNYGWNPKITAYITATFFLAVLSSGFFLVDFVKRMRSMVFPSIGLLLACGLSLIVFFHTQTAIYIGAILVGLAFGFFQPLIYDKTSYAINNPKKNIFGLSLVLTALYIAIALEPFVMTGICNIFKIHVINTFSFILSFALSIGYIVISYFLRHKFGFSIEKEYYS